MSGVGVKGEEWKGKKINKEKGSVEERSII